MYKVTLSFDNGPEPDVTPRVLDCLAHHGVKATFFVLGRKVAQPANAAIARRARAEGHRIGNHTYSHSVPLGNLSRQAALQEFDRTEQALDWLDQPQRLFRPYGGKGSMGKHLLHPAVLERLVNGGFTCVLWNSVPEDWHYPDAWVERAVEDCLLRPWSLVVLHDLPTGAMAHLDVFIRRIRDQGGQLDQEYPPDCILIDAGKPMVELRRYVKDEGRKPEP